MATFQVVEQIFDGYPRIEKDGRSTLNLWMDGD
jgi:hypothetical protein